MIFKKNPIDYKQPQENYCSNQDCYNKVAKLSWIYGLLDEYGIKNAEYYCEHCIIEKRTV